MLLKEMETFYWVVECQSFSQAAEKLGISKSSVSKQMNKLERQLNSKLLLRTTRQLSLTETGEHFYQHCQTIMLEAQTATAALSSQQDLPHGLLRISLPPALGVHYLAPFFSAFLERYPDIKLDVHLDNKLNHLLREGYDLVIRSQQKLEDSSLIAQPLMTLNSMICATPTYYERFGKPQKPCNLKEHNFAYYNAAATSKTLRFKHQTIKVNGSLSANHLDIIKHATLASYCIAVLPDYMIRQELQHQTLQACLQDYPLLSYELQLIYVERKLMPLKLKVFIDELKAFVSSQG